MPETKIVPVDEIRSRIRIIRGCRVLIDSDLADFYGIPTHRFNESVKRNASRFPSDFMFQINREELVHLISQSAISTAGHGGRRNLPYAFTEHGSIMAAMVLHSPRAVHMNLFVVRAFVALRQLALDQKALSEKLVELDQRVGAHDEQLAEIIEAIRQLAIPPGVEHDRKIGFHLGNR
jgi:hypothetical protein